MKATLCFILGVQESENGNSITKQHKAVMVWNNRKMKKIQSYQVNKEWVREQTIVSILRNIKLPSLIFLSGKWSGCENCILAVSLKFEQKEKITLCYLVHNKVKTATS